MSYAVIYDTFKCDHCDATTPVNQRYPLVFPRRSSPHDYVATMWLCPKCGAEWKLSNLEETIQRLQNDPHCWTFII